MRVSVTSWSSWSSLSSLSPLSASSALSSLSWFLLPLLLVATLSPQDGGTRRRGAARTQDTGRQQRSLEPTHANIRYGNHERNVLDLYLAKSEEPTPLVIYIHGGGFRGGDKRSINRTLLDKLADNRVSMAALNYRLTRTAPFPAQMHDCARAVQFLRYRARDYNLDPKRFAATGGSAGAGISQWLALHDDLADPNSKDPVARESTRLAAAAPYNAQTSYDPRFIQKLFDSNDIHPALIPFFGMKQKTDIDDERFHPLFVEASPIEHATADDPPLLFFFSQSNRPMPKGSTGGQHIHHPKFGIVMKEKLDKLGVECTVLFREDYPRGLPTDQFVGFFLRHFGMRRAVGASDGAKTEGGANTEPTTRRRY